MITDEFWSIIDRVHAASPRDMDAKCEALRSELKKLKDKSKTPSKNGKKKKGKKPSKNKKGAEKNAAKKKTKKATAREKKKKEKAKDDEPKKNTCPHCKKYHRKKPHCVEPDKCMWNKKYKGYRFKSICDELEVDFKPRIKFSADLGGYAVKDDSGSE